MHFACKLSLNLKRLSINILSADSTQLFLRPLAQKKCSFNPCSFAKCDVDGAKCLVDTKCRPLFVDEMGKRVKCRGNISARIVFCFIIEKINGIPQRHQASRIKVLDGNFCQQRFL